MNFLVNLLISVVFSFIAFLLTPKPKPPDKSKLEDFDIPKSEEGSEIPKIFGTVTVRNPQVVWYGDLRLVAIKEKGGKK